MSEAINGNVLSRPAHTRFSCSKNIVVIRGIAK